MLKETHRVPLQLCTAVPQPEVLNERTSFSSKEACSTADPSAKRQRAASRIAVPTVASAAIDQLRWHLHWRSPKHPKLHHVSGYTTVRYGWPMLVRRLEGSVARASPLVGCIAASAAAALAAASRAALLAAPPCLALRLAARGWCCPGGCCAAPSFCLESCAQEFTAALSRREGCCC